MAITTRSQTRRKMKLIFRKKQATVEEESKRLQDQATEQQARDTAAPSASSSQQEDSEDNKGYEQSRQRALWLINHVPPLPWQNYTGKKPLDGKMGPFKGAEWNWNFSWQQPEGTGAALHNDEEEDPNPMLNVRWINCRIRVPGSDIIEHHRKGRVELCAPGRKPWTQQCKAREVYEADKA